MTREEAYATAPGWARLAAEIVAGSIPNTVPGGARWQRVRDAAAKQILAAYRQGLREAGANERAGASR